MSHQIPQVEPMVMDALKFAEDLFFSSIGLQDVEICQYKDCILTAIRSAVIPLTAYCIQYDQYAAFYKLDVDNFNK